MKTLFTEEEFKNSKSTDKLLCECLFCFKPFGVEKKLITYELKNNRNRHIYCSTECYFDSQKASLTTGSSSWYYYFETIASHKSHLAF